MYLVHFLDGINPTTRWLPIDNTLPARQNGGSDEKSVLFYMKSILKHIGDKFNKVTILEYVEKKNVKYRCDCGNEKIGNFYDIKRGLIKGCGCQRNSFEQREASRKRVFEMRKSGIFKTTWPKKEENKFRYIWKCLNNRSGTGRKPNFLQFEDLEVQWIKQNGICPYSKVNLILPTHTKNKEFPQYIYASLDRIDSSQPYIKDNIQFVSQTINFAKNKLSHEEFETFLDLLVKNRTSFCAEDVNQPLKSGGEETSLP